MRQPSLKFASKPKRKRPEAELQKRVVQWLELTHMPGVMWLAIANEGKRSVQLAVEFKRMGMQPGAADLWIGVNGQSYFLELKAGLNGQQPNQIKFMQWCLDCGFMYLVAHSLDEALSILRYWGAIRPDRRAA